MKHETYTRENGSVGVRTIFEDDVPEDKSRTKQQFKNECDINKIMHKARRNGIMPKLNTRQPKYGDFTSIGEYRDVMDRLNQADESFASLPAETRNFFANDPALLIDFINNPANEDKAIELGCLPKRKFTDQELEAKFEAKQADSTVVETE